MKVYEIILIGVALAMDAFALTVANCTTYKNSLNKKKEWAMPVAFALFQFLMPVLGFYIGKIFSDYFASVSKLLTAIIFFILAFKIVFDNIKDIVADKKGDSPETKEKPSEFTLLVLLLQAVATSIDALMVGVTFSVELTFSVFIASLIIGAITFLIVAVALFIGKSLGKILGKYATWAGAVILLILAIKSLIELL